MSRIMTSRGRGLLSRILLLALVAGVAGAQEPSERWKRRNDRGNRFEGLIEIPVGRPQLEIVSFLGSREPYTEDVELRVRFFVPDDAEVSLQARELQEQVQYFMEAKSQDWQAGEWNEFGPWPTGDVLRREQVPAGNLGVLIRLRSEEEETLLPAFLFHSAAPAAVESYTLHVRPDARLSEVGYAVFQGEEKLREGKLVDDVIAGEAFVVKIEAADLPEGRLRLDLEGQFKGRPGGPQASYAFYHKAP